MDPACDCFDTADAFLTDYTWYCNQRYALTEGFSAANSRTYPIYSTLLRQPRPRNNDDIAFHGIGEYLYFGTYRKDNGLTEEQSNWMKMYQNYMSNFIRTGNPNDWTAMASKCLRSEHKLVRRTRTLFLANVRT